MDFRVLLAVGVALGCSLVTPVTDSMDGARPGQVLRIRAAPTITPVMQAAHGLETSSFRSAVFRTVHYQRQVEGVPLADSFEELPLKRHLPVWVF
ncbi:hypothetical protein [Pseudomonas vanderleydeniana]|uniref:Uncharacterized protein n=1 Tax=Pseudomonas vanderleydeniana TaxID=2745495 RepID=A0A9E6PK34_9PSED|nr:hypothetical protein [Pseudomonas vanderleydeniana]QXI27767.1 hypothetical protein HU752_028360 [Pseudomonas vanderleydeniana]